MAAGVATLKPTAKHWHPNQAQIDKSHKESIFLSINAFRQHKTFTDVVICIGEREFHAHRLILASSSPVIETMLNADMKERTEGRINLTESSISPLVFEDVLTYMYSGKIKLTSDTVEELLYVSTFLMMQALNKFCEEFLVEQLDIHNCLGIRKIASKYDCQKLFLKADSLLQKEFVEVSKSEEFDLISATELCEIICKDEIVINQEDEIVQSILRWADKSPCKRKQHFKDVLQEVRLQFLNDKMLEYLEFFCKEEYPNEEHLFLLIKDAWFAKNELIYTGEKIQVGKHIRPRHCLDRGRVILCCGGYDGTKCMQTCVGMNPSEGGMHSLNSMKMARQDHAIACLDGCIFVVGGFNSHKGPLDSVECFNPSRNEWRTLHAMNTKRKALGLTVLNGKLYVTGGLDGNYTSLESTELFDPRRSVWQFTGNLNEARYSHCLLSDENNIYAVGGWKIASVERFNAEESNWELLSHMSVSRAGATAELMNEKIYVVGGRGDDGCLTSMEVYDITNDQWATMLDTSVARWRAASSQIDDCIYVMGGRDANWQYLDCVECFNVKNQQWKQAGKLYTKLMGLCCSSIDIPLHHLK